MLFFGRCFRFNHSSYYAYCTYYGNLAERHITFRVARNRTNSNTTREGRALTAISKLSYGVKRWKLSKNTRDCNSYNFNILLVIYHSATNYNVKILKLIFIFRKII